MACFSLKSLSIQLQLKTSWNTNPEYSQNLLKSRKQSIKVYRTIKKTSYGRICTEVCHLLQYAAPNLSIVDSTFIAIPAEQRDLLANATERMPWEPFRGDLMSALSIGHQMHCLDQLRQSFWPQRYNNSIWKPDGSFDYLQFGHFGRSCQKF